MSSIHSCPKKDVYCCVPGCRSKKSKNPELSFHRFPQKNTSFVRLKSETGTGNFIDRYEAWCDKLKMGNLAPIAACVCALHFQRNDFFLPNCMTKRVRLKKIAVPSSNLPTEYKRSKRMCKKSTVESLTNSPCTSGVEKEPVQCIETRKIIAGNRGDTPSRNTNLSLLKSKIYKRKVVNPSMSVDIKRSRIRHSSKESIHRSAANNKNERFQVEATTQKNNKSIPNFRTVAVQTEPISRVDDARKEDDLQQVSFRRSIDFLRRNLVGHIQKFEETTFRVNECIISLTKVDQGIEKTETLVVRPNKLFSSCKLFFDYLLESNRVQEHRKTKELIPRNNISPFPQKCCESTVIMTDCDVDKNRYVSKDSGKVHMVSYKKKHERLEQIFVPDFSKELQVLLRKLPENLVEAAQNGHILKVDTPRNHEIEHVDLPNLYKDGIIEEFAQFLSVELSDYSDLEYDVFKHKNIGKDISTSSKICTKSPEGIQDSMKVQQEVVVQENEFHRNKSEHKMKANAKVECETCKLFFDALQYNNVPNEECPKIQCSDILQKEKDLENHLLVSHRTVLKKSEYACEVCPKKFITYKSLMYHNRVVHNLPTIEDVIFKQKCETCNELLEFNCYKIHLLECRKKYVEKQNQNIEYVDTVVQKSTANRSKQTLVKQKYPLMLERNYIIQREKLQKKTEKNKECSSTGNTSNGILNKLEALIGQSDGLNQITIVHLED